MKVYIYVGSDKDADNLSGLVKDNGSEPVVIDRLKKAKRQNVILGLSQVNFWTGFLVKHWKIVSFIFRDAKPLQIASHIRAFKTAAGQIIPPYSKDDIAKSIRGMAIARARKLGRFKIKKDKE